LPLPAPQSQHDGGAVQLAHGGGAVQLAQGGGAVQLAHGGGALQFSPHGGGAEQLPHGGGAEQLPVHGGGVQFPHEPHGHISPDGHDPDPDVASCASTNAAARSEAATRIGETAFQASMGSGPVASR
jgi:hypothetical protein